MHTCTDRKKRSWTNALYGLAAEYKRRHPQATAAEAWRHFCGVAATGAHDVALSHDSDADVLTYRPNTGRFDVRTIKRRSFEQGYYRLSNVSP